MRFPLLLRMLLVWLWLCLSELSLLMWLTLWLQGLLFVRAAWLQGLWVSCTYVWLHMMC